jgi:hypothetical protein
MNCLNPACSRELRYLRDGRVVRVIRGKDEEASMEHYWLCGACYRIYDFVFPPDGTVTLGNRSHAEHADEFHFRDVRLPERRREKRVPGQNREPYRGGSSL